MKKQGLFLKICRHDVFHSFVTIKYLFAEVHFLQC